MIIRDYLRVVGWRRSARRVRYVWARRRKGALPATNPGVIVFGAGHLYRIDIRGDGTYGPNHGKITQLENGK